LAPNYAVLSSVKNRKKNICIKVLKRLSEQQPKIDSMRNRDIKLENFYQGSKIATTTMPKYPNIIILPKSKISTKVPFFFKKTHFLNSNDTNTKVYEKSPLRAEKTSKGYKNSLNKAIK